MFDLKSFAKDLNVNQTQIGEDLGGLDQSQVSLMMNKKRRVRLEHIEKLREKYGDIVDQYRTDGKAKPQPQAVMSPAPEQADTLRDIQGSYDASKNNVAVIEQPPFVPDNVVRRPDVDVMEWVSDPNNDHSQNAFNIASIMRRTKFVIQMNNNAMAPTLKSSTIIWIILHYSHIYIFLRNYCIFQDRKSVV